MIGTTRQQVAEALCDFRRSRLVSYERTGSIKIVAGVGSHAERMSEI